MERQLNIRVTEIELGALQEAADACEMTVSSFLRYVLRGALKLPLPPKGRAPRRRS